MDLSVEQVRGCILEIISTTVKRQGIDKLVDWLEKSDFFTAPASTRFHLSCRGGLALHSLHVYNRLYREVVAEYGSVEGSPYSEENIAIVSLFHDLCKVHFYKETTRNVKNEETGQWEKVPYYMVEDQFPMVHGPKSQYILAQFIGLSAEESMSIMHHMGGFDVSVKGGDYALMNAFGKYPLALLLHMADMKATNLDES